MSNKTNIEDIKILEEFLKDLYTTDLNNEDIKKYLKQAIENILEDRERLEKELKRKNGDIEYIQRKINKHFISDVEYMAIQAKANNYDRLVENIKDYSTSIVKRINNKEQINISTIFINFLEIIDKNINN